jgi:hypothetical protein
MDIIVPTDKPHTTHPSGMINIVRTLAIFGWVGYVLFFSMVFSEGNVSFPHLQRTVQLVGVSFAGFLLTWRLPRIGGLILLASMVLALALTPSQLQEWRGWFYLLEAYMAITGLLFMVVPRRVPN